MPGFDGTGPLGQGPMTGRGQGFCVLTTSQENPNETRGFAGIDGKLVGQIKGNFEKPRKEVINMPFGDGTGPARIGPITSRAAGFCAGYPVPGYMNPVMGGAGFYAPTFGPYGAGSYGHGAGYGVHYVGWANPWLRRGFGFGRGFGRGRGWGRGFGRGLGRGLGRFGYWW